MFSALRRALAVDAGAVCALGVAGGRGRPGMASSVNVKQRALALGSRLAGEARRHWRLLVGAAIAAGGGHWAIELSDYQGRFDIPVRLRRAHDLRARPGIGFVERGLRPRRRRHRAHRQAFVHRALSGLRDRAPPADPLAGDAPPLFRCAVRSGLRPRGDPQGHALRPGAGARALRGRLHAAARRRPSWARSTRATAPCSPSSVRA